MEYTKHKQTTDIENKLMMTKVDKEEGIDKLGLWD